MIFYSQMLVKNWEDKTIQPGAAWDISNVIDQNLFIFCILINQ